MGIHDIKQNILDYLSITINKTEQDRINICAWVYKTIITYEEYEIDLFRFFLENADDIESKNQARTEILFSETDVKDFQKRYGSLTDAVFEKLLVENYPEDVFYKKLWQGIRETVLFDSEKAQIFALYYIWIDARIPYYHLDDGLDMSNPEFSEITNSIKDSIKKARFILKTNKFDMRTTRASVLLKLLEEQSSFEYRTVLLAHIISILKPSVKESLLRDIMRTRGIDDPEG